MQEWELKCHRFVVKWKTQNERESLATYWVMASLIASLKTWLLSANLIPGNNRRLRAQLSGQSEIQKSSATVWTHWDWIRACASTRNTAGAAYWLGTSAGQGAIHHHSLPGLKWIKPQAVEVRLDPRQVDGVQMQFVDILLIYNIWKTGPLVKTLFLCVCVCTMIVCHNVRCKLY